MANLFWHTQDSAAAAKLRFTVSLCLVVPEDGGPAVIYHLLPEVEPFSEHTGGSLSRWAANILKNDDAQVICPAADHSWGFASERVHAHRGMQLYGRVLKHREYRLRIALRVPILQLLLRKLTLQLKPDDILYIHNRPESVLALKQQAPRRNAFKVVLHMHNDHLRNLTEQESSALQPDLTIFNSRFLEEQGRKLLPALERTSVLYNGADERCFHPPAITYSSPVPTVLFVGRLIPEKGVHVLVEAMRLLYQEGARVKAKIIGSVNFADDTASGYVYDLRRARPANVDFLPYTSGRALADHFRSAAMFCCPSVWEEPFGMVNVEAMASGLPVVASAVGGIPEIFTHGGAVLVPKDSPRALANALRALAEDEPHRRRLAQQALTGFQQRFRWSVLANEYRMLMQTLSPVDLASTENASSAA